MVFRGHAASLLELVLPSGPSLVDPAAAASMEDLEGYTVRSPVACCWVILIGLGQTIAGWW